MSKKRISIIVISLILLPVGAIFWVRFVPVNKIPFISKGNSVVSKTLCMYPITVAGESMEPFLKQGSKVEFSKCFKEADLKSGNIVVYTKGGIQRIAIIRSTIESGRKVYIVSNEKRSGETQNIIFSDIIAYLDTDTSTSTYKASQAPKIDEDATHYFSESYLVSIPINSGIETAELNKTTDFDLENDKFCFVVNPIKDLHYVDFIVTPKDSDKEIFSVKNAHFQPGKNTNCHDEMKGTKAGDYEFKISVENIRLLDIPFKVK